MKKQLPPDTDGMNDDRAHWALSALQEFRRLTGSDEEDALPDFLCDLMHLSDRRGDHLESFDAALQRARDHYEAETAGTGPYAW